MGSQSSLRNMNTILKQCYSILREEPNGARDTRICEIIFYNYRASGDITNVTVKDLLYKGKPKKHSNALNASRSIDKIERHIGTIAFKKLFISITPANGVEFSNAERLERSFLNKKVKAQFFYSSL